MLWTSEDVCAELKIKKSTLYQMTCSKQIPFFKMGGSLRFSPDEVAEWLNGKRVVPIDAA